MKKVAIIGAGISGLAMANFLNKKCKVTVYEKDKKVGGLIKCDRVNGNLYHLVGGHVFNSKRNDVLEWFWSFFDKKNEFTKSIRNAIILLDNKHIDYPIENHLYQLKPENVKGIISDLIRIIRTKKIRATNFEEFLRLNFGETLYQLYFKPYNEKIWKCNLSNVPLSWLEGKLPMPSIEEILYNNFKGQKEMNMVHSSFYYPKINGSQFIADRLAQGLNIIKNENVNIISKNHKNKFRINNSEPEFDVVIYTGNIKKLPFIINNISLSQNIIYEISNLGYHGTTTALCRMESVPYSWIYLPDKDYIQHRIICTGNFAVSNNANDIKTATVEFTDCLSKDDVIKNIKKLPYSLEYIDHRYTEFTYPIQNRSTSKLIQETKSRLESQKLYLLGRFAEWEYYNMDTAMGAAKDLAIKILS